MSAAEIKTKIDEAVAANEAGDFATALTKLRSARLLLVATPDARQGEDELKWRSDIDALMKSIEAEKRASVGITRKKIVHARPTD